MAAQVHVGLGLGQQQGRAGQPDGGNQRLAGIGLPGTPPHRGELVDHGKSGVVGRVGVTPPGIAKTDHQLHFEQWRVESGEWRVIWLKRWGLSIDFCQAINFRYELDDGLRCFLAPKALH